MALDPKHIGKKYGPYTYQLGLEKMREFSRVIAGGSPALGLAEPPAGLSPLLYDEEKAQAGPHGAVIAFPTFVANFAVIPFGAAIEDPALNINALRLVHGEQDLEFLDVMRAGDTMTTVGTITQIYTKADKDFLVVVTESTNQHGKRVVRGTWTGVIRS